MKKTLKRKLQLIWHNLKFAYKVAKDLDLPWDEKTDVNAGIYAKQIANEIGLFNSANNTPAGASALVKCLIVRFSETKNTTHRFTVQNFTYKGKDMGSWEVLVLKRDALNPLEGTK